MRRSLALFLSLLAIVEAGCSKSDRPEAAATTPQPKVTSNQPASSSPAAPEETGTGA